MARIIKTFLNPKRAGYYKAVRSHNNRSTIQTETVNNSKRIATISGTNLIDRKKTAYLTRLQEYSRQNEGNVHA